MVVEPDELLVGDPSREGGVGPTFGAGVGEDPRRAACAHDDAVESDFFERVERRGEVLVAGEGADAEDERRRRSPARHRPQRRSVEDRRHRSDIVDVVTAVRHDCHLRRVEAEHRLELGPAELRDREHVLGPLRQRPVEQPVPTREDGAVGLRMPEHRDVVDGHDLAPRQQRRRSTEAEQQLAARGPRQGHLLEELPTQP